MKRASKQTTDRDIAFAELGKPVAGNVTEYTAMIVKCIRLVDRIDDALGNSGGEIDSVLVGIDANKAREHLRSAMASLERELLESVRESATARSGTA